jgi:hypothetical protein
VMGALPPGVPGEGEPGVPGDGGAPAGPGAAGLGVM